MAKKKSQPVEVQKFGGIDELGQVSKHGHTHEAKSIETQSKTSLEQDAGVGEAAIIRRFTFGVNPEAFNQHPPTQQELFNYHAKGIETALWRDGMRVMPEVKPRLMFNKSRTQYYIFVGARPQRGHLLREAPQTLSEIVHGNSN